TRLRSGDDVEDCCGVANGSGHGAVSRQTSPPVAVVGSGTDPPAARLEPDHAADPRGQTDRPTTGGAGRDRCHAGGDGCAAPAGRASCRTLGCPRVASRTVGEWFGARPGAELRDVGT